MWRLFCILGIVFFFGMLANSNWFLLSNVRIINRFLDWVWYLVEDIIRAVLKKPKRSGKYRGRKRYYGQLGAVTKTRFFFHFILRSSGL